jgi:sulfur-oxidizing protein SoxY
MMDRRHVLASVTALLVTPASVLAADGPSAPKPPSQVFDAARDALANGREIKAGRVSLDLPRLAESGNSVPLKVSVDSPMTAADYVKTIHLFSEQNPIATMGRLHLSPRAGRAEIATSVRLAMTQNVHAIAEMSDGSLWFARAESVVLLAACVDGG